MSAAHVQKAQAILHELIDHVHKVDSGRIDVWGEHWVWDSGVSRILQEHGFKFHKCGSQRSVFLSGDCAVKLELHGASATGNEVHATLKQPNLTPEIYAHGVTTTGRGIVIQQRADRVYDGQSDDRYLWSLPEMQVLDKHFEDVFGDNVGLLAGRLVVIDAGHGIRYSGAAA